MDVDRKYRLGFFVYKYLHVFYKNYKKIKEFIIKENKKNNIENRIKKQVVILKEQKNFDFNLEILEKIITFCKKYNIKIILLTTPFQREYNNFFKEELLEKNFYKVINKIVDKYEIDYFDFSKDYKNFDKKIYFENYDYDHLSLEGSKKFIKILNKKLILEEEK